MNWFKRVAIVLGVVLAILLALPFLFSLNEFIPQIEREISARLQEPVSIKKIGFAALPLPHITVDDISVGKTGDLKLGKVTVTPDLFSLLGPTKTIRSVDIDSLVLTQKAIERMSAWTKSDASRDTPPPPVLRVENIRLDNAVVKFDKTSFGPFDARVGLGANGDPEYASIVTQDGKLKATIKPDQSGYMLEATAKSWKPPLGPAIVFDELIVKGTATSIGASFSQISAKLYGGSASGKATLGWHKGLQLKGNFDVNQVELKTLVPLLSPGTNMSGRLAAKPAFSASAGNANQLLSTLRLETPFNVENGVLYGVDIKQAATSLIKQGASGGETRFDQLAGHLSLERGSYRFTGLRIASGVLAADGNVSISPAKELSGRVNAKVGSGLASAAIPIDVSGTVNSPMLLPTRAALAGAAAGSLLLPGVGTGLGAKVGQAIEGLFGRKEEKSAKK